MLLFLDACIRGKESRTKQLCEYFFEKKKYALSDVEAVNLSKSAFKPLDFKRLKKRDRLVGENNFNNKMFDAAKQFFNAEKIVIGAPLWDNSFPAVLKNYIEQICVSGLNFCYTPTGPKALCKPKKVLYICTSGGKQMGENLGYTYIKSVMSGFFGSGDTAYVSAEMLDVVGVSVDEQMEIAKKQLSEIAKTF